MKIKAILVATVVVLVVAIVALTGCSSPPKSVDELLSATYKTWTEATSKTITDEITVSGINVTMPITYGVIPYNIKITNASLLANIDRKVDGNDRSMAFVIKNINVPNIPLVTDLMKLNHKELAKVVISGGVYINNESMTIKISAFNIENVMPDLQPVENIEVVLMRSDNAALINSISPLIEQSTFGNISDKGRYDRKEGTYGYSIAANNVNAELFKVFKILLEGCGDLAIDDNGSTINGELLKLFGSSNLIQIINTILMPGADLAVSAILDNKGSKYYFTEFRGIYAASGIVDKSAANAVLDMLKSVSADPTLSSVSVTKNVTISANIAIKTTQKLV